MKNVSSPNFHFHKNVIYRLPAFSKYSTDGIDEKFVKNLISDDIFMEALYFASPLLYQSCQKIKQGELLPKKKEESVIISLAKYFLRGVHRATPFGLFAGCGVGQWQCTEEDNGIKNTVVFRKTRLDMYYLCHLSTYLQSQLASILLYRINSTAYFTGSEMRFIERTYHGNTPNYQMVAVELSTELKEIISSTEKGKTREELVGLLLEYGHERTEAINYLDDLVEAQILISQLDPIIVGPEYWNFLLKSLCDISIVSESDFALKMAEDFKEVDILLKEMDSNEKGNFIEGQNAIVNILQNYPVSIDIEKLLQVDLYYKGAYPTEGVDHNHKKSIGESIDLLSRLFPTPESKNINSFIEKLYSCYEEKAVPLMQALDGDIGIGYEGSYTQYASTLIQGVEEAFIPDSSIPVMQWNEINKWLFSLYVKSQTEGLIEVDLEKTGFENLLTNAPALPPSMSVMYRIIGEKLILLEGAVGNSATSLLARFSHGNSRIYEIINDVVKTEEELNPDIAFAEILHLPENRIGNVIQHPPFRSYEIPCLVNTTNESIQISLSDLMICVRGQKLILFSKSLQKRVVPRLSNAHNHSSAALTVYRFLCDYQNYLLRTSLNFNWGAWTHQLPFLPRIKYKSCILSAAKWNIKKSEVKHFLENSDDHLKEGIHHFCTSLNLPRKVLLTEGDNELLIDLDNPFMVKVFLKTIKHLDSFILKEYLGEASESSITKDLFKYQWVASLLNDERAYSHTQVPKEPGSQIQRHFELGSTWLYAKLYCSPSLSELLIEQHILPLTDQLLEENCILGYFLTRYIDEENHLRIRLKITDQEKVYYVLDQLITQGKIAEKSGVLKKICYDRYVREVERYGSNSVTIVEKLFCIESNALSQFLKATSIVDREDYRWIFAAMNADEFVKMFFWEEDDTIDFYKDLCVKFNAEFNVDEPIIRKLIKQKMTSSDLWKSLDQNNVDFEDQTLRDCMKIIKDKNTLMRPLVDKILFLNANQLLEVPLNSLVASMIHMLLNRLFTTEHRKHETIIYNILHGHSIKQKYVGKASKQHRKNAVPS